MKTVWASAQFCLPDLRENSTYCFLSQPHSKVWVTLPRERAIPFQGLWPLCFLGSPGWVDNHTWGHSAIHLRFQALGPQPPAWGTQGLPYSGLKTFIPLPPGHLSTTGFSTVRVPGRCASQCGSQIWSQCSLLRFTSEWQKDRVIYKCHPWGCYEQVRWVIP